MRRWSYSHGLFTLDFGDYEDYYITVLTNEGEATAQLIASYIDQILKTRVDVDHVVEDDNDEVADAEMMEGEYGIAQVACLQVFLILMVEVLDRVLIWALVRTLPDLYLVKKDSQCLPVMASLLDIPLKVMCYHHRNV